MARNNAVSWDPDGPIATIRDAVYPQSFSRPRHSDGADHYLKDPLIQTLAAFFEEKGLAAVKDEDQREQWYDDWIAHQARHQLYARLLSPREWSNLGTDFDLLRYTRFLEVFAYFSPAHGYSLQVTFLGLHAILMGDNADLKREAIEALERGELLAFGVSEKDHGADLLGNEFKVVEADPGRFIADGTKYYIGNSGTASIIAILARNEAERGTARTRRARPVLFALRPGSASGFRNVRKIRTLGVRAAHVGEFEVRNHELPKRDVIAEGRQAWNAVFGSVSLGKFFLGFGSIGICEHALAEARAHLRSRVLYGKPAIEMPHIRTTMTQAFSRLTAMKMYAYRGLDYLHSATDSDRRFLLYAAVQKAKLSTEGVKVMALLSECIGARGFESDTYFEMALRDVQLIPGLEGSTHINLGLATQFMPRYFADPDPSLTAPGSWVAGDVAAGENDFLWRANSGAINRIGFPHFLNAYRPFSSIASVRQFVKAAKAFQLLMRTQDSERSTRAELPLTIAIGHCFVTIAYGQLIAENAARLNVAPPMISVIFHALVSDLNIAALALASCEGSASIRPTLVRRMISIPSVSAREYDFVAQQMNGIADAHWQAE